MAKTNGFETTAPSLRPSSGRRRLRRIAAGLLSLGLAALPVREASALIMGGEGNRPIADPGWPKGSAPIFNHPGRVAWWEGPPFGGGEWHAECRGDAKAMGAVLADFARLDSRNKRVILHDGVGHSVWLNTNRDPAKEAAARIDWSFTVWRPDSWQRLRRLPPDLRPTGPGDPGRGPPARIDVYTGGPLRWADVTVPKGLEIDDQRLEGHGFTTADGLVLEGRVTDLATGEPLAARVRLERIVPQSTGGYRYEPEARAVADDRGRWVLKHAPAGWLRVVVEADGFAPRVAGHGQFDGQPRWASYDGGLSRPATVTGRVVDEERRPLADVDVRLQDVTDASGGGYESPDEPARRTGLDGRFRIEGLPIGRAAIRLSKRGYCRPGLGLSIATPAEDVVLSMQESAGLRVVVEFAGSRPPGGYLVEIEPEGGARVGTWGGSGEVDAANRIAFHEIPPGRYVLRGRPNPSSGNQHQAGPLTVDLKGGRTVAVTLHAR